MSLLDLIYPKRCVGCGKFGAYVCVNCFSFIKFAEHGFCTVCQKASIDGLTHPVCRGKYEIDGVFASVVYAGVVKRLIYQFKYNPHLTDLRNVLDDLFYEGVIQKEVFIKLLVNKCVFNPIPLHKKRMRQRGYNQSKVLADGLVKRLSGDYNMAGDVKYLIESASFLERVRETKPQYGLSQKARIVNIAGAFELKRKNKFDAGGEDVIFLVDDIVTSGATFREVGRVLKRAGCKRVFGIALAHG